MIGSLKYGVWNDRRTEWERSTVYGHFDALAALMYLVRNIDQASNPIPKFHSVDEANTFINREEREKIRKGVSEKEREYEREERET